MKTTKNVVLANSNFALEIPASKLASKPLAPKAEKAAEKRAARWYNEKVPQGTISWHSAAAKKAWVTIRANRAAAAKAVKAAVKGKKVAA